MAGQLTCDSVVLLLAADDKLHLLCWEKLARLKTPSAILLVEARCMTSIVQANAYFKQFMLLTAAAVLVGILGWIEMSQEHLLAR